MKSVTTFFFCFPALFSSLGVEECPIGSLFFNITLRPSGY